MSEPAVLIQTDLPRRLDALPWLPFHTRLVLALGITWVLDGLEVTLAGSVAGALQATDGLGLSEVEVGMAASAYLAGAVLGAIGFGWLADRYGRKRLFYVTLLVYAIATGATAFAGGFGSFACWRFLTGAGIGGEYAAINSAIQEWIPARHRGRTDLIVNGSFWIGAALGAGGAVLLLRPGFLAPDLGWRVAFGIGALLALGILFLRRHIPESARWLMTHGRPAEAERLLVAIEAQMPADHRERWQRAASGAPIVLDARAARVGLAQVVSTLVRRHPRRSLVGTVLMASQAFCYNAIFFTFALVLGRFYGVPPESVGLYLLPFAAGNFLGPLLLGHWFDTIGRRVMISLTYALAGLLLVVTAWLFAQGLLGVQGQTLAWSVIFFFASAAASSAYLTIGESFPLEIRALAIALFYAFGTAIGGVAGPWVFGALIGTGERGAIAWGYGVGALLMLVAAAVQWRFGLDAERRSLEDLAPPLSAVTSKALPPAVRGDPQQD